MRIRTLSSQLCLILAALLGCAVACQAQEPRPLKVGMILPMSGPLADYGIGTKNFVDLAIQHDPALKNAFTVVYEDSEYATAKTVSAYRKLVVTDHVDIVYAFGAPMLQAIAPLAEKDKIPFFSPESDGLLSSRYAFTFLFMNEIGELARGLVKEIERNNWRTLLVIKNENQFINTWVRGLSENLLPGQTMEVFASVEPGTNDFRTIVSRLKDKKFDALGVFLLPGSHRALISQLSQQAFKPKFFGSDGFQFKPENEGYFDFVQDAILCELTVPESLKAEYERKFGASASIYYSIQGYRFANFIGRLAHNRGSEKVDGDALRRSILSCANAKEIEKSIGCSVQDPSGSYDLKVDASGRLGQYFSFPISAYRINRGEMEPRL